MIIAEHTYHGVELNTWPSQTILDWLNHNMGQCGDRYIIRGRTIYFYAPADHLLFLINWG
jgi:hypothetical protein